MKGISISKKRILEILDKFPDEIVVEDFIDRVIIVAKIDAAREQFKNGDYLTEEELDDEIKRWG